MSVQLLASGLELIIDREGGIPHVTQDVCVISFLSFFAPGCTAHISHGKGWRGGSGSGRQLGFNQLQIGWMVFELNNLSLFLPLVQTPGHKPSLSSLLPQYASHIHDYTSTFIHAAWICMRPAVRNQTSGVGRSEKRFFKSYSLSFVNISPTITVIRLF